MYANRAAVLDWPRGGGKAATAPAAGAGTEKGGETGGDGVTLTARGLFATAKLRGVGRAPLR